MKGKVTFTKKQVKVSNNIIIKRDGNVYAIGCVVVHSKEVE